MHPQKTRHVRHCANLLRQRLFAALVLFAAVAAVGLATQGSRGPSATPRLTRGPYLQFASDSSITILWHTDRPTDSRVDYGEGKRSLAASDPRPTTRHEIRLSSLRPGTTYRYRVASGGVVLRSGASFATHKAPGRPFRFAVFGDSGSGGTDQYRLGARIAAARPDFVLHTGDVVYPAGAEKDYDARFFRPYAALLERTALWPTPGNHDWRQPDARPYFNNFVLPTDGPKGVLPERNYTFNYGDATFISVDSDQSETVLAGQVAPWLRERLASSRARWRFVFFHHPPYSTGPHGESRRIQRTLVPLFAPGKIDVVFSGHDHTYERIGPLSGVTYIVTGAGGHSLYARKRTQAYTRQFWNRSYSFTLAEVQGSRLRLSQIAVDGSVVDRVGLSEQMREEPSGKGTTETQRTQRRPDKDGYGRL